MPDQMLPFEKRKKSLDFPFFIPIILLFALFWIRANDLEKAGLFKNCHGYPSGIRNEIMEEEIAEIDCNFETRLGEEGEFGILPLISFPGSGNT